MAIGSDIRVVFNVLFGGTAPGESVCVVGGCEQLGKWKPDSAFILDTAPGMFPLWTGRVLLKRGSRIEYKFGVIRARDRKGFRWEKLEGNRQLDPEGKIAEEVTLYLTFGNPEPYAPPLAKLRPPGKAVAVAGPPVGEAAQEVKFVFNVMHPGTNPGESVCVLGDCDELGNWSADAALVLETSPTIFPLWTGHMVLRTAVKRIEYKFAVMREREPSSLKWETVQGNRVVEKLPGATDIALYLTNGLQLPHKEVVVIKDGTAPLALPSPVVAPVAGGLVSTAAAQVEGGETLLANLKRDLAEKSKAFGDACDKVRTKEKEVLSLREENNILKHQIRKREEELTSVRRDRDALVQLHARDAARKRHTDAGSDEDSAKNAVIVVPPTDMKKCLQPPERREPDSSPRATSPSAAAGNVSAHTAAADGALDGDLEELDHDGATVSPPLPVVPHHADPLASPEKRSSSSNSDGRALVGRPSGSLRGRTSGPVPLFTTGSRFSCLLTFLPAGQPVPVDPLSVKLELQVDSRDTWGPNMRFHRKNRVCVLGDVAPMDRTRFSLFLMGLTAELAVRHYAQPKDAPSSRAAWRDWEDLKRCHEDLEACIADRRTELSWRPVLVFKFGAPDAAPPTTASTPASPTPAASPDASALAPEGGALVAGGKSLAASTELHMPVELTWIVRHGSDPDDVEVRLKKVAVGIMTTLIDRSIILLP